MKSTNYIINGVLIIAVIVLFILHFTGKNESTKAISGVSGDSASMQLPVAYINTDTLLQNYKFAIDLNEKLMNKMENSTATIRQKQQQFMAEVLEFQKKASNNAFLTRERAASEEARLEKKQQSLEEEAMRMREELSQEQAKLNQQMSDTVVTILKEFNKTKKYQIIFANFAKDNLLYSEDAYNITSEVLEYLNQRYTPAEK